MGRFYKTVTPQKMEFMSELPEQMMMNIVQNADARIKKQEMATAALAGQLDAQALQPDKTRLDEIVGTYETQIDDLARGIQDNPLDYLRQSPKLTKLAQDINKEWKRGEVASIQANFNARENFKAKTAELVKSGKIRPEDYQMALNHFDMKFREGKGTQYDPALGLGRTYDTEELNPYVDMESLAETRGKDYAATAVETLGASLSRDGKYIVKSKDSTEYVKYEDIYNGVLSAMMKDEELMSYYKQRMKWDASMGTVELFSKLHDAADRVATKYSYEKKSSGITDRKADPYSLLAARTDAKRSLIDHEKGNIAGMSVKGNMINSPTRVGTTVQDAVAMQNALTENKKAIVENLLADRKGLFEDAGVYDSTLEVAATNGDFSFIRANAGELQISPELIDQAEAVWYDMDRHNRLIQAKLDEARNAVETGLVIPNTATGVGPLEGIVTEDQYLAATSHFDNPVDGSWDMLEAGFSGLTKDERRKELKRTQSDALSFLGNSANWGGYIVYSNDERFNGKRLNELVGTEDAPGLLKPKGKYKTMKEDVVIGQTDSGKDVTEEVESQVFVPSGEAGYQNLKVIKEGIMPTTTPLSLNTGRGDNQMSFQIPVSIATEEGTKSVMLYLPTSYVSHKNLDRAIAKQRHHIKAADIYRQGAEIAGEWSPMDGVIINNKKGTITIDDGKKPGGTEYSKYEGIDRIAKYLANGELK